MPQPAFLSSTIGRKMVMAITGLVLIGFVVAHMVGNLLLYQGPDAINEYGHFLRTFLHGWGLWLARGGLVVAALLHIGSAVSLAREELAARPVRYRIWKAKQSTYASRTMRWSGVIVLVFLIYHLLHFTTGAAHPDFVQGDVYHNVVTGFRAWPVALFYVVAMVLLGLHLRHGVWSLFQSLGVSHPRYLALAQGAAAVIATIVVLGNVSFPLSVLFGLVGR